MKMINKVLVALPAMLLVSLPVDAGCGRCAAKKAARTTTTSNRYVAPRASTAVMTPGDAIELPPNANPGECFARFAVPAKFETQTDEVIAREASERIEVIPAVYETVTEEVMVRPASHKVVDVPARFERVTEQVMVSPARSEWQYVECRTPKSGDCNGTQTTSRDRLRTRDGHIVTADSKLMTAGNGQQLCLVEIPAKYETISKLDMVQPPTTRTIEEPAEYRTITRQVVKEPARQVVIAIPAEYKSVTRQVMVADAHSDWQQVDCTSGQLRVSESASAEPKSAPAAARVSSLQR